MVDKKEIIRPCEFFNICEAACGGTLEDIELCSCYGIFKQLKRKEQECEELKREIAFGNNGKLSDKIRAIVFKDLNAENSKYKQALDEIEDIVIKANSISSLDSDEIRQILNIINKAREE
jgi:hypothetical protein|nr:MAG TPA: hypothetical protein [Caudoviricetes sp.]